MPAHVLHVRRRRRMRLQARDGVGAQRPRGVLDGLPERRARVRQPVAQWAHVGVRVPVEDRRSLLRDGVAEKVAVRRLVAAAQDDDETSQVELTRHHLAQRGLIRVEVAGEHHVAQVGRVLEQGDEPRAVARVRREAMQPLSQLGWRARGPRPATVAAHALVGRESDQHRARRLARVHRAPEQLPEARILAVPVGQRLHRVNPSTTVCTQALGRRW